MILPDVNLLVPACLGTDRRALDCDRWLKAALSSGEPVALVDVVLTAVVRISTHTGIWRSPASIEHAVRFVGDLRAAPSTFDVETTAATWSTFERLCLEGQATGNLVPDAWIAANAITCGATLMTADRGFARYPGLRFADPLTAD